MADFVVRQASPQDSEQMAELFAAVAQERTGIATEPPVDVAQLAARFAANADTAVVAVAVAGPRLVGMLNLHPNRHGFADLGMLVDRDWRGRGVGTALVDAAIDKARGGGLHKLSLEVFVNNEAAIALYRRCGFVDEGVRRNQYRRASGELWDVIMMGLEL